MTTSTGVLTQPAASRVDPIGTPRASVTQVPEHRAAQQGPCSRRTSISSPDRNSRKASPIRLEDLHRQVHLDPAEHRRPEHDAGHQLEHDRRQPQPRREAEGERRRGAHQDDEEQVVERHVGHGGPLRVRRSRAVGARPR